MNVHRETWTNDKISEITAKSKITEFAVGLREQPSALLKDPMVFVFASDRKNGAPSEGSNF
jgi:hypothetical protein